MLALRASVVFGLGGLLLGPGVALAQPSGGDPPVQKPTAPPPTAAPSTEASASPPPSTPSPSTPPSSTSANAAHSPQPVDDAAWSAVEGKQVVIQTPSGPVKGELLRSQGPQLVVVDEAGAVKTVPKSTASGVKVVRAKASQPAAEIAALDPPPPENAAEEEGDEELSPAEQRRKERREKREQALLGAFTMQGATYSHWRGDGIKSGHASYAMDYGLGVNLSPTFGMYAMAGGLFATKLDGGDTKGNYGHVDFVFAMGGKYYFSMLGAGGGFSRLKYADGRLEKDRGLSIPGKLMGKIPLPHKLYIGLGITYEFAAVRGFDRFINAIGGQLVVGRW